MEPGERIFSAQYSVKTVFLVSLLFFRFTFFLIFFLTFFSDDCVSPKAAAEELGYTFLPCVLSYLHRAPSLIKLQKNSGEGPNIGLNLKNVLTADDVDAVIVPVSTQTYEYLILNKN